MLMPKAIEISDNRDNHSSIQNLLTFIVARAEAAVNSRNQSLENIT